MARDDLQFNLRYYSPALKDLVKAAAKANSRSETAEINARLEQSFVDAKSGSLVATEISAMPAILSIDAKLEALCRHLGVKGANE